MTNRPLMIRKTQWIAPHRSDWSWTCRICDGYGVAPKLLLPDTYAAAVDHLRTEHPEATP